MSKVNSYAGSYDVGRMRAAKRMVKQARAEATSGGPKPPSDSATLGTTSSDPTLVKRQDLESLHQDIKPTREDTPNHTAGWVVGLMAPIMAGTIESSRKTMEKYSFLKALNKTKGSNAAEIKQNALKSAEKQQNRSKLLDTVSSATAKIGIATALGVGVAAVAGALTLPLGLIAAGVTVASLATSGTTSTMSDTAKEGAANTQRFAEHVQAYSDLALLSDGRPIG